MKYVSLALGLFAMVLTSQISRADDCSSPGYAQVRSYENRLDQLLGYSGGPSSSQNGGCSLQVIDNASGELCSGQHPYRIIATNSRGQQIQFDLDTRTQLSKTADDGSHLVIEGKHPQGGIPALGQSANEKLELTLVNNRVTGANVFAQGKTFNCKLDQPFVPQSATGASSVGQSLNGGL